MGEESVSVENELITHRIVAFKTSDKQVLNSVSKGVKLVVSKVRKCDPDPDFKI